MYNLHRARVASLICLGGGTIQIIYGLLSLRFPFYDPNTYYGWDEILWALATIGMIGGVVGLLSLDIGRPPRLALIGAGLSCFANVLRIIASIIITIAPASADSVTPLILLSILLLVLGMVALGIATLRGRQLTGWQAWMPLVAGLCPFIITPIYGFNLPLHFFLLGLWGIPWLLIGYSVYTNTAKQLQVGQGAGSEHGAGLTQPR